MFETPYSRPINKGTSSPRADRPQFVAESHLKTQTRGILVSRLLLVQPSEFFLHIRAGSSTPRAQPMAVARGVDHAAPATRSGEVLLTLDPAGDVDRWGRDAQVCGSPT
jgi:hypothetical protein